MYHEHPLVILSIHFSIIYNCFLFSAFVKYLHSVLFLPKINICRLKIKLTAIY